MDTSLSSGLLGLNMTDSDSSRHAAHHTIFACDGADGSAKIACYSAPRRAPDDIYSGRMLFSFLVKRRRDERLPMSIRVMGVVRDRRYTPAVGKSDNNRFLDRGVSLGFYVLSQR